ncbi:hypothetical protein GGI02_002447 [Coemansia sp. RSA 2322]|nr:hypothetical protein GGI02_002447 [Coemansia sp. RSA 2322]
MSHLQTRTQLPPPPPGWLGALAARFVVAAFLPNTARARNKSPPPAAAAAAIDVAVQCAALAVVAAAATALGCCRGRKHTCRASGLICGAPPPLPAISEPRPAIAAAPHAAAPRRVLRACDLDAVSRLEPPPSSAPLPALCPICLDAFSADACLRVLRCEHRFHALCVDPWLTTCSALCPMCKADCSK